MVRLFKHGDSLSVSLQRYQNGTLKMKIESDYRFSYRKDRAYFNKEQIDKIKEDLQMHWKRTKTKKLQSAHFYLDEIDWHTNHTDIYQTPVFSIKRGERTAKVKFQEHGSIPKDWAAVLVFYFKETNKITPIVETFNAFFGYVGFSKKERAKLEKMFRNVLTGKINFGVFLTPEN